MKRTFLSVSAVLFAGIIIGQVIGGHDGTASAKTSGTKVCADKTTGVLRLASVAMCKKSEKRMSLGARGPRGATGLKGDAGEPGEPGATGPTGDTGPAPSVNLVPIFFSYLSLSPCGSQVGYYYTGSLYSLPMDLTNGGYWSPLYSCYQSHTVLGP